MNGHHALAEELKDLEKDQDQTGLAESLHSVPTSLCPTSSTETTSSSSTTSTLSITSPDVFLRPSPRRCDLRKQRHLSIDLPVSTDQSESSSKLGGGCPSPASSWTDTGSTRRGRLIKRPSVDSGINLANVDNYKRSSLDSGLDILQKYSRSDIPSSFLTLDNPCDDLDSPMALEFSAGQSPHESLSSEIAGLGANDETRVLTLAEQIIAALPERIKGDGEDVLMQLEGHSPVTEEPLSHSLDMDIILDDPPDTNPEFNFEFSDISCYRYIDVGTPSSSMSPASSSCLPSPASFTLESPSPPPTTADFSEFFQASNKDFSKDFSNLTLSDREQRELYEAAKTIQKAYRLYKGRKRILAEQDKERQAAVVIQNYYRRYKQFVYYRQMSRAATLIQNQFRSYCEHKRFKKSQEIGAHSSVNFSLRGSREATPIPTLKRTYSQRRQHQAARKIQQFMRQTKQKENEHWQPKERKWARWDRDAWERELPQHQQREQQHRQHWEQPCQPHIPWRPYSHSSSRDNGRATHWGSHAPHDNPTLYSPAQPLLMTKVTTKIFSESIRLENCQTLTDFKKLKAKRRLTGSTLAPDLLKLSSHILNSECGNQ
ncbi:unnamed protein product, partial [Meganyctiphanes norvegica]